LGYAAADELAPAPKVDEEPSATILIGLPLAKSRAVRGSGKSNRACSGDTVHAGEDVPGAPGPCTTGSAAAAAIGAWA
jgi:hypothetical protein